MKNEQTKIDKAVEISIVAGALIVGLSIAYYLVIYIPQRDKAKAEQQQQEKQILEKQREKNDLVRANCLASAEVFYYQQTKNAIESSPSWDRAEKTREADQANCYKQYPQK